MVLYFFGGGLENRKSLYEKLSDRFQAGYHSAGENI
jgi:hypothetical protein